MGSQQRQHLVSLGSLPSLCAQIAEAVSYQSNADYILSDLQAPLSLLAMLFRRCEPNTLPAGTLMPVLHCTSAEADVLH